MIFRATPHKDRLTTLYRICLIFFRHTAQKSLDIRQYACKISVHSDEKIYCASSAQSLCGIALNSCKSRVKATPHKDRLTALHRICLIFFRHSTQNSLEIRQYSCGSFMHSDEKICYASSAQSLCGIAFIHLL